MASSGVRRLKMNKMKVEKPVVTKAKDVLIQATKTKKKKT